MRVIAALLLALVLAPPAVASEHVPGRVVVGFSAGSSASSRSASRDAADGRLVRRLALGNGAVQVLDVGRGRVRAAVRKLSGRRGVRYAEPDYVGHVAVTPNDPDFASQQWDMAAIGMPDAWETTTGSADVKVAVLDTGIDLDHPDLDDQLDAADGHDSIDGDAVPDDANGHGTHVAGIAGARGGNGVGVAGVSWGSSLIALRVCDAGGSCPASAIADGIARASAAGARVANLSIAGLGPSTVVANAITAASGTLFVVAAGNAGRDIDADAPDYPCSFDALNLVCVAASRADDALMTSSNRGSASVDLAAPGSAIWSTLPDGTYGAKSGTSMAAPHVAGAAALLWAKTPGATVADVRRALLGSAVPLGLPVATGGRLDVSAALQMLLGVVIEGPRYGAASAATSIGFHAAADGARFNCRLDEAAAYTPCSSPYDTSALSDGRHTLRVRIGTTIVARTWTVDRTLPSIAANPPTELPRRLSPVRFNVTDATATTTACALDGGALRPCATPWVPDDALGDGDHRLLVRATDAAGNTGETTVEWHIDAAPVTVFRDKPPALDNNDSATFTFAADGATGFRCSLDDAPFADCTDTLVLAGLTDGKHVLHVGATDGVHPNDQEWSTYSWSIDTVAPPVTITGGPPAATPSRAASVTFAVGEGLGARCVLDSGSAAPCTSPFAVGGLGDGPHAVTVLAKDAAGNIGTATRSWVVDATAPGVTVDGATVHEGSASIAFHADQGALTSCALDGSGFAPCTSPVTYDGLTDGRHGFEVRAADALGNTASATTALDVKRSGVATPIPAPAKAPKAVAPSAVVKAVAKRLAGRTPAAVARLKPFRVSYRAASGGTLTVTVKLARVGTVLHARGDASAARTLRPQVHRTAAARRLARRTRATLSVAARFTPVKGRAASATRRVTVRQR